MGYRASIPRLAFCLQSLVCLRYHPVFQWAVQLASARHPFPPAMNFYLLLDTVAYWAFRTAGYALLNLGEDAALIAFMFC
ncbi:MAG: hypothetical protein JWR60_1219 [Polaromonas sp.]|nr:hypothetical protein [Polaromonas sp.]